MDVRIVGSSSFVCVIVVVAGVLFYSNDFKTSEGNNNNTLNISDNNTTNTSTNQMALTFN